MHNVYRAAVANVNVEDVAKQLADRGIYATLTPGVGVSPWGIEPAVVIETATSSTFVNVLAQLLDSWGEDACYVTTNGRDPFILYANGRQEEVA